MRYPIEFNHETVLVFLFYLLRLKVDPKSTLYFNHAYQLPNLEMINKSFIVSALSIVSIVAAYSLYNNRQTEEKNNDYINLAVADNERFASGTFSLDQAFTSKNNHLVSTQQITPTQTANNSDSPIAAPAINAVAIAKFINGKLPSTTPNGNNGVPTLLSQTGAFSNLNTLTPSAGLIPYDIIEPF